MCKPMVSACWAHRYSENTAMTCLTIIDLDDLNQ